MNGNYWNSIQHFFDFLPHYTTNEQTNVLKTENYLFRIEKIKSFYSVFGYVYRNFPLEDTCLFIYCNMTWKINKVFHRLCIGSIQMTNYKKKVFFTPLVKTRNFQNFGAVLLFYKNLFLNRLWKTLVDNVNVSQKMFFFFSKSVRPLSHSNNRIFILKKNTFPKKKWKSIN